MKGFYEIRVWSSKVSGDIAGYIFDAVPAVQFARWIVEGNEDEHAQIMADHWKDGSVIVEDGVARWQYGQTDHEDAIMMISWKG